MKYTWHAIDCDSGWRTYWSHTVGCQGEAPEDFIPGWAPNKNNCSTLHFKFTSHVAAADAEEAVMLFWQIQNDIP